MRRREFGYEPWPRATLIGLGVALVVVLIVVVLAATGPGRPAPPRLQPPAPGPVIGRSAPAPSPVPARELRRARHAAARFLRSYLPYLYGRRGARSVKGLAVPARRALTRGRARVTPSQRGRRPRTERLELLAQSARIVLATARVVDGGAASYPLTFSLERHRGRWIVSSLGND